MSAFETQCVPAIIPESQAGKRKGREWNMLLFIVKGRQAYTGGWKVAAMPLSFPLKLRFYSKGGEKQEEEPGLFCYGL